MGIIMRSCMVFLFIVFAICQTPPQAAGDGTPPAGSLFPEITLTAPDHPELLNYLGLKGPGPFSLSRIGTRVLIVEVFSMYCPHCQREAPTLNALYKRIADSASWRDQVRIIGIGAGNSSFEVDFFQKQYQVPFPLFPDEDFTIHKQLGEVRTPYFFGLRLEPDRPATVFFSQLGGAQDAGSLMDALMKSSGLEK